MLFLTKYFSWKLLVVGLLYAMVALQVRRLVRSYRARKNMNRATGGFLIAMGGLVGLAKRAA